MDQVFVTVCTNVVHFISLLPDSMDARPGVIGVRSRY
jgi:hypothetical protein